MLTIESSLMIQIASLDELLAKHDTVCKKLQWDGMDESMEVEEFVAKSTHETMKGLRAVKRTLLRQVAAIRKERANENRSA